MKAKLKAIFISMFYVLYFCAIIMKSNLLGNILSPIVTFISFHYVLKGYFFKEQNKILKIAGLLLGLSIFNWFLCDTLWGVLDIFLKIDPEQINLVEYGYSFTNMLLLFALLVFSYNELKKWNGTQLLIDTITITSCIMILIWVIFFNQDIKNAVVLKEDWISMLTLSTNFLIFTWNIIRFFSIRKENIPLFQKIVWAGGGIFVSIDILYYYQYFYNTYVPNSFIDGGYVISFALMAIGSIIKINTQNKATNTILKIREGKVKSSLLVIAPILLVATKGLQLEYLLLMSSIIICYFAFTSYIQKNIYRDELLQKETQMRSELEQKVQERTKEITHLLNRDIVTELFSRRYFMEWLEQYIEEIEKENNIILFFINLHELKMIKTMYGNNIGEMLLREMGKRLRDYQYKGEGVLASYGEDVFVLAIIGKYTYGQGLRMAKEMVNLCRGNYCIQDYEIMVTASIGISIFPMDAKDSEQLIKHADIAMTQAMMMGYNKVVGFDQKLGELVFNKNEIEMKLKKVCFHEAFLLYYQPQVLCESGKIVGFEALIRWQLSSGKFIPPYEFIPIAEQTGLIIPIGKWVIETAFKQLVQWDQKSLYRPRMAINVSVKQLVDKNFISNMKAMLDINKILPERIEIEITESIQLEEKLEIKESLQKIRNMGISIAIDDFGTGYSSLYYLKHLPINRIKIAKPLIDNIDKDPYDCMIVKMAISISKLKGIRVIAEGVETKEQWDCLKQLGCDEIQGYYFSKPMPAEEAFMNWMPVL